MPFVTGIPAATVRSALSSSDAPFVVGTGSITRYNATILLSYTAGSGTGLFTQNLVTALQDENADGVGTNFNGLGGNTNPVPTAGSNLSKIGLTTTSGVFELATNSSTGTINWQVATGGSVSPTQFGAFTANTTCGGVVISGKASPNGPTTTTSEQVILTMSFTSDVTVSNGGTITANWPTIFAQFVFSATPRTTN